MLSATPGVADAASDVFMCVAGITGSSTDQQFEGCSQIFGVSYSVGIEGGAPPPGGGGGGPSPRSTCGLYVVSKAIDDSSVPILIRSLLGRRTAEVEFATRTRAAEPFVFLELLLRDVLIVEVEQDLDAEANLPVERIVMQPGEVNFEFTPQEADGAAGTPVVAGFDCVRNRRL
jgi:type VI protein secretion system component Hcp